MSDSPAAFQPAVAASENQPELTLRALVLGAFLGVVFGAASTYLALRVGLTTSASVPIAVLSIWAIRRRNNQRAILEHNIVQTTGSAGESVAAAVVFSVPALIFLGYPLQVGLTTLIALTGGCLGVLMMVPLRRYLIVKEHGVLRYPEGKACAEILEAGEEGGTSAGKVFVGLGIGAAFKFFQAILQGVKQSVATAVPGLKGAVARLRRGAGAARRRLHHRLSHLGDDGRGLDPLVADPDPDDHALRVARRRVRSRRERFRSPRWTTC